MQTLTYGLQLPESNDKGDVVFPAMEANITQLDGHKHDGVDSSLIDATSITSVVITAPAASWALVSGGHYKQTVNLPGAVLFDNISLSFKLTNGAIVYPSVVKTAVAQFDVFFDDPTQDLKVYIN